jgi:hypothetical protein
VGLAVPVLFGESTLWLAALRCESKALSVCVQLLDGNGGECVAEVVHGMNGDSPTMNEDRCVFVVPRFLATHSTASHPRICLASEKWAVFYFKKGIVEHPLL